MGKKVLVADRKALARIAYTGTLETHGYEVVGQVTTGMDVVQIYRSAKPDLVLMSAILSEPGGDGLLIIRKLLTEFPDAAIVAYANPKIASRRECMEAGAKGFFLYPARPDEMMATVNSVLG